MKVTLIAATPHALETLIFTKNTRLKMTGEGLAEVIAWPEEKKQKELEYMKNTIQSSWEFVDYVLAIEGVTRAFTHQLVRHRVGTSFAQQAQRVVDMSGFQYLATGEELNPGGDPTSERDSTARDGDPGDNPSNVYDHVMQEIDAGYNKLTTLGVKPQDARGVLPTNVLTNIVFKANLRTLHDMALKRLCVKAQGEFQDVFRAIVAAVASHHPWAESFLRVQCAWNGTCLFPTLPVDQCHVKPFVYDPVTTWSYGQNVGMDTPLKPLSELVQIHARERRDIQPVVRS